MYLLPARVRKKRDLVGNVLLSVPVLVRDYLLGVIDNRETQIYLFKFQTDCQQWIVICLRLVDAV